MASFLAMLCALAFAGCVHDRSVSPPSTSSPTPAELQLIQGKKDDLSDYEVRTNLRVYDAIVVFPAPPWQVGGDVVGTTEVRRDQQGPIFIFEQIPKGQEFNTWTKMHAVLGQFDKSISIINPRKLFDNAINQSFDVYIKICEEKNFSYDVIRANSDHVLYVQFCEDSSADFKEIGYGEGIGEISIFRWMIVKNTLIKVYFHWRGRKFDKSDPSTWPMPQSEFDAMLASFNEIRAVPVSR